MDTQVSQVTKLKCQFFWPKSDRASIDKQP